MVSGKQGFDEATSTIIQANFKPSRLERWLKRSERVFILVLILLGLVCLGVYNAIILREAHLVKLSQEALDTTEMNTQLETSLHELQSFEALSERLAKEPNLNEAEDRLMIELSPEQHQHLQSATPDSNWQRWSLKPKPAALPAWVVGY